MAKKKEISLLPGKKPQNRNGKIKPLSKSYDPDLAKRRDKEKRRRIAERKRRQMDKILRR